MEILFVEDDPAIALRLVSFLEKDGYKVQHGSNKKEALQRLENENFDLLLLDIGLRDASEYDIRKFVKQR